MPDAQGMAAVEVKDEPEEPEEPQLDDPIVVPPCVVLEKLGTLLKEGRIMLRYQVAGGWAINGKVKDQWMSFKAEGGGVCQLADDTFWTTEEKESWCEEELEELEGFRKQALKYPCAALEQPNGMRPRACRRSVFEFHRKRWAERRAKAKAGKAGKLAPPPKGPAKAKVESAKAKVESAKADAPKANTVTFRQFLEAVKVRFLKVKQLDKYKKLLAAVKEGANAEAIVALLAGHSDLIVQFRRIPKPAAKTPTPPGQPPPPHILAQPEPEAPPAPLPAPESLAQEEQEEPEAGATIPVPTNDLKEEAMKLVQRDGASATAKLMGLVFRDSGIRASTRLAFLRYLREAATDSGSYRQLILLRGPPGVGLREWAKEQLGVETAVAGGNELIASLAHVCSSDDFCVKFSKEETEEKFAYVAKEADATHARNEARVEMLMENGIQPIYVADCHIHTWEMQGHIRQAQKHGYEVTIMGPQDISEKWQDTASLIERNTTQSRPKSLSKELLQGMIDSFEDCNSADLSAILEAKRKPRLVIDPELVVPTGAKVAPKNGVKRPMPPSHPPNQKQPARPKAPSPPVVDEDVVLVGEEVAAEEPAEVEDTSAAPLSHTSADAPEALAAAALMSSFTFFS